MVGGVKAGSTCTVLLHTVGQPFRVTLSVSVNGEVEGPAITRTIAPFVAPLIVPFPVIVHEWVTVPPTGLTTVVSVENPPEHTLELPMILHDGGFGIRIVMHAEAAHPFRVTASQTVYVPLIPG